MNQPIDKTPTDELVRLILWHNRERTLQTNYDAASFHKNQADLLKEELNRRKQKV